MGGAKIKEYKEISFKLKGGYNQLGNASALLYFTFQADCGNNGGGVQFFKVFILLKKWAGAWPPAPPPPPSFDGPIKTRPQLGSRTRFRLLYSQWRNQHRV